MDCRPVLRPPRPRANGVQRPARNAPVNSVLAARAVGGARVERRAPGSRRIGAVAAAVAAGLASPAVVWADDAGSEVGAYLPIGLYLVGAALALGLPLSFLLLRIRRDGGRPTCEVNAVSNRRSMRPRRIAAASLSAAGTIHLLLTPAHFEEQVLYGVFFVASAIIQLIVAQMLVLRPSANVVRAGAYSSLGLIALWIVTRFIAPPLASSPESVTLWGVLAKGLELTALVALVGLLPAGPSHRPTPARPRFALGWALGAGVGFAVLFLLASASLLYVPKELAAPAIVVDPWQGPSLMRPWVEGPITPHVYVNAPWSVLVFAPLAGALLAVATGLSAGLSRTSAAPGRSGFLAALPAFVAVPSCCGAPLGAFIGASALPALIVATPWLLLVTVASLVAVDLQLYGRWRSITAAPGGTG